MKKRMSIICFIKKKVMGLPMTSTGGACVRNWKRQTEKQKESNVMLRLLEIDEA
jgi:hypothetical protein